MWNYNLVLPELVISTTFFIFYFSQNRLPLKINRAFLLILFIDTLTFLADVSCSLCLEFLYKTPQILLRIQNTIYFILFLQRIMCFFMFTNIILGIDLRKSILLKSIFLTPFIIVTTMVILNLITDTIFSISLKGEYFQGPFYNLIYICAFFYVIISIFAVIINRNKLNYSDYLATLIFNIILFIGYIIRILYPRYLIMNFFTLIAIIIIYLSFQNPTLFREDKSSLFNKKALKLLFNEINFDHYNLVIGFSIRNYKDLREIYSSSQTDRGLFLIGTYLKQNFPKLTPFYIHDGHFVLVGKNENSAGKIIKTISERFDNPWNPDNDIDMMIEVNFLQVNPQLCANNRELLFNTLVTSLSEIEDKPQTCLTITAEDFNQNQKKIEIKRAVEIAVDHNSVELFLQPVIDAKNHKLIGAESLARIRDENGEYIPPFLFIPIAEKNGRISILGEQMFEKTCRFIKENDINAMGLSWINVNLSPIQFLRRDLSKRFTAILKKYDIDPEKIHLEITEESMIDFTLLEEQMQNMKNVGFKFVLDDYGRGYSNVARMKKCPFINIKLDMEFVWDYFKYKDMILPTLVQTIKQMGFTVTAEGIESLEMAEALRDIGCDNLQGFYFSKPISANEFMEKYSKNTKPQEDK